MCIISVFNWANKLKIRPKIFISYTLRDNILNINSLNNLNVCLQPYCTPFIDIIHNKSFERQIKVIDELLCSKMLILLNTIGSRKSKWVNTELELATKYKIPIFEVIIRESQICDNHLKSIISLLK